ncbi:uncharacterized protein LOC132760429 [Ruditapes philippinarum]|uniref:uncharacterized protein LOC132760429 n=1 Tax=Ruditapes philippinarum TaxID=129788 RepID=UPI00295ABAE2|nr:uncharacterized protein LOC132760429 [Ruditapes philippinarum]
MSETLKDLSKLESRFLDYPNFYDKLNETLDDIGVNNDMVHRRRQNALLGENIGTVMAMLKGYDRPVYNFGSRSEGTTTISLQSDADSLHHVPGINVVQSLQEFEPEDTTNYAINLLMIQGDDIAPGYCHLEVINEDLRLSSIDVTEVNDHYVRGKDDRIYYKNTVMEDFMSGKGERHGPAWAVEGQMGITDQDTVAGLYCKSWPYQARDWLNESNQVKWPSDALKRKCMKDGCFVVPTGSSPGTEFEWRISTSLAERQLMFSLNIVQLRCYVLMKILVKTFIKEGTISSFMCKNVLLQCIESSLPYEWKEANLSQCLDKCLKRLRRCVDEENCPHFMIPTNNLMAGKFSEKVKSNILEKLGFVISYTRIVLVKAIKLDDLSIRLRNKLVSSTDSNCMTPLQIRSSIKAERLLDTAVILRGYQIIHLTHTCKYYKNTELQQDFQRRSLRTLDQLTNQEDENKREVSTLVSPFLSSLLGSLQAARVEKDSDISKLLEAEDLLIKGCDSDVSSGRLKLASYFYCSGKIGRTESILNETDGKYDRTLVIPICRCYQGPMDTGSMNNIKFQEERNLVMKNIVAYCVIFLPAEIKWIPKELQYELYRLTGDKAGKSDKVTWMDWAVVDSLPYLHFLQYKVNKHFHDEYGLQRALLNMEQSIGRTRNLCHRETALNLLGQCMEQNNQPIKALECYSKSLRLQPRNNAAKVLICICLARLFQNKKDEVTKTIYQRQRKMEQN